jgi:PAS domain-containing protein
MRDALCNPDEFGKYLSTMKAHAIVTLAFLAALLVLPAPALADGGRSGPMYVDLNARSLYARLGFDPKHISSLPPSGASGWEIVPPASFGGRTVRVSSLHLPGIPQRPPFSLGPSQAIEFTYLMPFDVGPEMAALLGIGGKGRGGAPAQAPRVPGVFLAGLCDNWEIYLNGVLIVSQMHLAPDGSIASHRNLRAQRFPLPPTLFREGENVIAIRFVADPGYLPAGIDQASPFYIDDYARIEAAESDVWAMVLIGLYFFIGLYHIFMYLVRTQDRHNLFYGLFSLDLGLYLFTRTYTITLLVPDSSFVTRAELFTVALILPLVGAFLEALNDSRVKKVTIFYGAFCALDGVAQLLVPLPMTQDVLRVWQASGVLMSFYYFGFEIFGRFVSDCLRRWKRERETEGGRSLGAVMLSGLGHTPSGNLVIGGLILFATGVFDIVDAVVMHWDLLLTKYGFFLFTMGTALILANRFGFLHDRLADLNRNLEERIGVLMETGARLTASERRYRSLFDGSSEPVALLTEDLAFIEGNMAAKEFFGLNRRSPPATLFDAVYAEKSEGSLPVEFLRAAARALKDKKAPGEIVLRIKSPIGEPRTCNLRLERIADTEREEILLRASPEEKDELAVAFVEGRERFDIVSSLSAADKASRRATAYLSTYMDEGEARFLASCLREVVVNAVEHGNLRIDFDEKSRAMREGRYFELLQERREDPRFRRLRVIVEYSVSASRATFRVTDEGPGFNHAEYVRGPGEEPDPGLLEHGRGLYITMSAFDRVLFNEKGNQITLVKFFGAAKV